MKFWHLSRAVTLLHFLENDLLQYQPRNSMISQVSKSKKLYMSREWEGANDHSMHFDWGVNILYPFSVGAHVLLCQLLGSRCPHMPFFTGGHMSGGGDVLHEHDLQLFDYNI